MLLLSYIAAASIQNRNNKLHFDFFSILTRFIIGMGKTAAIQPS